MIELKVREKIMNKPVNCGCGGNVDVHFIGNTYIGDYHKFTGKYFICCEKCGVKTPICKTREEAIEIWNKAIGERTAKVIKRGQTVAITPPNQTTNVIETRTSLWDECGNCGTMGMYRGWKYCPQCGARLEWE